MIWYSSIITAMWLQQNHNDDVSILQNIISENECYIIKSESKEAEDELSLNINEQLIQVMLQCDELQKKQKLTIIQSKIEILKVIQTTKRSY